MVHSSRPSSKLDEGWCFFGGCFSILFQGFLQRSVKCLRFKSGHLRSPKASPRSRWSNSSSRWSLLRSLRSKNSMALPWSVAGRPTKSTGEKKNATSSHEENVRSGVINERILAVEGLHKNLFYFSLVSEFLHKMIETFCNLWSTHP